MNNRIIHEHKYTYLRATLLLQRCKMLGPYLPLDSNGMDVVVDHGCCLHNLRFHCRRVRLRVVLEVKAP